MSVTVSGAGFAINGYSPASRMGGSAAEQSEWVWTPRLKPYTRNPHLSTPTRAPYTPHP